MKHHTLSIAAIGAITAVLFVAALVLIGPGLNLGGNTGWPANADAPSNTPEDGAIAEGEEVSVFDDNHPAISNLNPDLLAAVRAAAKDASAQAGYETVVASGWRSTEYQRQLFENAVRDAGSVEEAAKWVATAETSSHVFGEAVDLGPTDVMYWVQQHGARYGLCQTYANEVWHYELRREAVTDGCPEPYADPSEDPRLQG